MSVPTQRNTLSLLAALVIFVSGVVLPETLGSLRTDYNSVAHYLSELGAVGAEWSRTVNLFGFLPVAIAAFLVLVLVRPRLPREGKARHGLALICFCVIIGYSVAVFFPCDYGCPVEGSTRQAIHNLGGIVAYPAGIVGMFLLGAGLRKHASGAAGNVILVAAVLMLVSFLMMLTPDQAALRGLWQRLVDYSLFATMIYLSVKHSRQTV